ncbi:MAG: hypothetical protein WDZ41_05485 [Candidatus Babeliales bacterium]
MTKDIIKASGEKEPFSIEKFNRSLRKVGASENTIIKLAEQIQQRPDLKTTQEIYRFALNALKKEKSGIAARYNLKKGLYDFGPTGFPFEQFVGELFKHEGFAVTVNLFMAGFCVEHEIDIIAKKNNHHQIFESKFHNRQGLKTDVKVVLYVQARFEDVKKKWDQDIKNNEKSLKGGLVTNTKFTTEAITYGVCVDLDLLSWSFPADNNLAQRIDRAGLYPITCLTTLNMHQKKELIKNNLVLCKDVYRKKEALKQLNLNPQALNKVLQEAENVCKGI